MRYKLTARVDGDIYIDKGISVERDGLVFEFHTNAMGKVVEVSISTKVPEDRVGNFSSTISPGTGGSKLSIRIGEDKELYQRLVHQLQVLEVTLSFPYGALNRLEWDAAKREFIPENARDERILNNVGGFSKAKAYDREPVRIPVSDLEQYIQVLPRFESLYVPIAFWHEGLQYFERFHYVQAFYNFYFVIEDFYAGRKTSKKQVLKNFLQSTEFVEISKTALSRILGEARHRIRLENQFKEENCALDVPGLHNFLFEIRGNLHHYFSESSKTRGHPFNQDEYESVALLAQIISTSAILKRIDIVREGGANSPSEG